jgi:hypothetical protein
MEGNATGGNQMGKHNEKDKHAGRKTHQRMVDGSGSFLRNYFDVGNDQNLYQYLFANWIHRAPTLIDAIDEGGDSLEAKALSWPSLGRPGGQN